MSSDAVVAGRCVLVVDDDPVIRRIVSRGLEPLALGEVVEVEDGVQAQEVLQSRAVDVVITDVLMPRMDGRALMGWAKEHCPGPVWIVLSGLDTFDAAIDALHLGAFDFLAKPLEAQRLRVAVRNALGHADLLREKARLYEELELSNVRLQQKVGQLEDLCRILGDQAEVIHQDLKRAEVIQRALLPHSPPTIPGYSVTTLYRPGRHVGGDFFEARPLDDRHTVFVVADAAGHGVAAAMLSVLFKHWLHGILDGDEAPRAPAAVLSDLNARLLTEVSARGLFVTAAYAVLELQTGRLRLASAGHPPALHSRANGDTRALGAAGPAVGLYADARFEETLLELQKGDRVFLYTDGLLSVDPAASAPESLARQLARRDLPNVEILRALHARVERSEDAADRDDVTLMLLEAGAGPSHFDVLDAAPVAPPRAAETRGHLTCCESGTSAYVRLSGRVTWIRSQVFHDFAMASLEGGSTLTVDLSECEYLDSTLLGTIHEVVSRGSGSVRVQGVGASLRQLFEELDMRLVLDHSSAEAEPAPGELRPLSRSSEDSERRQRRVLRAHEVLASLSEENREQFRDVVESLREELSGFDEEPKGPDGEE